MHLTLATLNFPPQKGGVEQLCGELASGLHGIGVHVHVLAPRMAADSDLDAALPYAVTRYRADGLRHLHLATALETRLREGSDHVLFGQWTAAGPTVARELLQRRGTRMASLGHAKEFLLTETGLRSGLPFAMYRRVVLQRMHPMLCVSRYTASVASAAGAPNVEVLHPGVDSVRFAPDATEALPALVASLGRPLLLSVARLVTRKGVDTVIEALPGVLRAHPGLTYVVVGDGPDRGRLQALALRLGVAEHVAFLGSVDNAQLPALYRAADLFVLASRQESKFGDVEGFGLVLLEAQACGTPVIAANSGGMPDAFVAGETGMLVPPSQPAALTTTLVDALADRPRLQAMAVAARRHALASSWRATAERAAELISRAAP